MQLYKISHDDGIAVVMTNSKARQLHIMHSCAARLVNRRPFAHVMQLHSVIARPSEYLTHNATLDHDTVDRTRDQSREKYNVV